MSPARRAQIKAELIDAVEHGATMKSVCARPEFPTYMTVWNWTKADPDFRLALRRARGFGPEPALDPDVFQPLVARRFLDRVRSGEAIGRLIGARDQPNRRILAGWRRQRPAFAGDLDAARREGRAARVRRNRAPRPYDEAAFDRVMIRLIHGEPIRAACRAAGVRFRDFAHWRRNEDDGRAGGVQSALNHALRMRARARGSRLLTPELTGQIAERIAHGATLRAVGLQPDMPSRATLGRWVRTDAIFRDAVHMACDDRDLDWLERTNRLHPQANRRRPGEGL